MQKIDGIEFADDHVRITPSSWTQLDATKPADIARMIWRIRYNNDGLLYRSIKNRGFKHAIRKIDTIAWSDSSSDKPGVFVPPPLLARWKLILYRVIMWREDVLEKINASQIVIDSHGQKKQLLAQIVSKYPNWKNLLGDCVNDNLESMTLRQLQTTWQKLEFIAEMKITISKSGDIVGVGVD